MKTTYATVVLGLVIVAGFTGCPMQGQYSAKEVNLFQQLPGTTIVLQVNDVRATELLFGSQPSNSTESLTFNNDGTVDYVLVISQGGGGNVSGTYEIISRDTAVFNLYTVDFILQAHGINSSNELIVSVTGVVGTGQV